MPIVGRSSRKELWPVCSKTLKVAGIQLGNATTTTWDAHMVVAQNLS
jgi:hypothetical protein